MNLVEKVRNFLNRRKKDVEGDTKLACDLLEQTPYPNTALIAKARLLKTEYFLGFIESALEKFVEQEEFRIKQEAVTDKKNAEIEAVRLEKTQPSSPAEAVNTAEVIAAVFAEKPKKIIPAQNEAEFKKKVELKNNLITSRNMELNKLADFAEEDNDGRKAILEEVDFLDKKIEEISKRLDELEKGESTTELIVTASPDITQQINNLRSQITKASTSIKNAQSPAKKKRYEDKLAKLTNTLNELYEIKANRQ